MTKLNIYFDQQYFLRSRKFIDKKFSKSAFINPYLNFKYKNGFPINDNYIFSGPQKLVNNLIKVSKLSFDMSLNPDKVSKNNYFCNFDENNYEKIEHFSKDNTAKFLVGPLYNQEYLIKLSNLVLERKNIKIVVASESAKNDVKIITNTDLEDKIFILPVGVFDEKKINYYQEKRKKTSKSDNCLIYFKNRKKQDLDFIQKNIGNYNSKVFSYGDYKNDSLINASLISKFGILIGSTESQGIAINELLGTNLPLLVLDKKINNYEGIKLEGTSVPYWSGLCGELIDNFESFNLIFDRFIKNIDMNKYQPNKLIVDELSFQKMIKNLHFAFDNF